MDDRILLVGENSELLTTRAMLLSDWETMVATPAKALQLLKTEHFRGILLCHSVATDIAEDIIALATVKANSAILAIRLANDSNLRGAENHLSDLSESPAWLSAKMSALLADKNVRV